MGRMYEYNADIQLHEGRLKVTNGKLLPSDLADFLKANRYKIIETLERDEKAKKAGFLCGISDHFYERQYSSSSRVIVERIGEKWDAWRETSKRANDGMYVTYQEKVIVEQTNFEAALHYTNVYLMKIIKEYSIN
jgi:hypothetical protein